MSHRWLIVAYRRSWASRLRFTGCARRRRLRSDGRGWRKSLPPTEELDRRHLALRARSSWRQTSDAIRLFAPQVTRHFSEHIGAYNGPPALTAATASSAIGLSVQPCSAKVTRRGRSRYDRQGRASCEAGDDVRGAHPPSGHDVQLFGLARRRAEVTHRVAKSGPPQAGPGQRRDAKPQATFLRSQLPLGKAQIPRGTFGVGEPSHRSA